MNVWKWNADPPEISDDIDLIIDFNDHSMQPQSASIGLLDLSGLVCTMPSQLKPLPMQLLNTQISDGISDHAEIISYTQTDIGEDLNFCSFPSTSPVPDTQKSLIVFGTPTELNQWEYSSTNANSTMQASVKLTAPPHASISAANPSISTKCLGSIHQSPSGDLSIDTYKISSIEGEDQYFGNAISLCYSPDASQWQEIDFDVDSLHNDLEIFDNDGIDKNQVDIHVSGSAEPDIKNSKCKIFLESKLLELDLPMNTSHHLDSNLSIDNGNDIELDQTSIVEASDIIDLMPRKKISNRNSPISTVLAGASNVITLNHPTQDILEIDLDQGPILGLSSLEIDKLQLLYAYPDCSTPNKIQVEVKIPLSIGKVTNEYIDEREILLVDKFATDVMHDLAHSVENKPAEPQFDPPAHHDVKPAPGDTKEIPTSSNNQTMNTIRSRDHISTEKKSIDSLHSILVDTKIISSTNLSLPQISLEDEKVKILKTNLSVVVTKTKEISGDMNPNLDSNYRYTVINDSKRKDPRINDSRIDYSDLDKENAYTVSDSQDLMIPAKSSCNDVDESSSDEDIQSDGSFNLSLDLIEDSQTQNLKSPTPSCSLDQKVIPTSVSLQSNQFKVPMKRKSIKVVDPYSRSDSDQSSDEHDNSADDNYEPTQKKGSPLKKKVKVSTKDDQILVWVPLHKSMYFEAKLLESKCAVLSQSVDIRVGDIFFDRKDLGCLIAIEIFKIHSELRVVDSKGKKFVISVSELLKCGGSLKDTAASNVRIANPKMTKSSILKGSRSVNTTPKIKIASRVKGPDLDNYNILLSLGTQSTPSDDTSTKWINTDPWIFNKQIVTRKIKESGGRVITKLDSPPLVSNSSLGSNSTSTTLCISSKPVRTKKFLSALAAGIPIVSLYWLNQVFSSVFNINKGTVIDHRPFILSNGESILCNHWISPQPSTTRIFSRLFIYVSSTVPSITKDWEDIIVDGGGCIINRDLLIREGCDYVVSDDGGGVDGLGDVIVVSTEFIVQCLIHQTILDPLAHPRFYTWQ